jgi:hypothetical protein
VDIYDGFESKRLSAIWSDWRFLPGALEIQSEVVKHGKSACKITLRPGDQMDDEKGTILERAELAEFRDLVSHEDIYYSYSFSIFLPRDFPIVSSRLVIAQWKQYSESENFSVNNPVIALRYKSGKLRITCQVEEDKIDLYKQKVDIRNKWLDFKFHIRFSTKENGRIKAWMNEEKIVDYAGPTAYSEKYGYTTPNYFYFKIGLYRDRIPEPMTIYIDEYRKQRLYDSTI